MKKSLISVLLCASLSFAGHYDVLDPKDLTGMDIFGYRLVTSGHYPKVYAGAVGSNSKIELSASAVYNADLVSGGSVVAKDPWSWGQSIYGLVFSNSYVAPNPLIVAPTSVNPLTNFLPRSKTYLGATNYGTQDVHISDGQILELSPGNYGRLSMGPNSKLQLFAGTYQFKSFSTAPVLDGASSNVAELIYDVAGGDIEVNVFERLVFAGNTKSTFVGPVLPSRVHFNTWQLEQLDLVSDAAYFYGNINAPQARVTLGNGSFVLGAIRANEIDLGYATTVCAPPTLRSLWHTMGALGPAFDPIYNDYISTLRPGAIIDTLRAAAGNDIQISYPDGQVVSSEGTYRVKLFDPKREAFLPGCGSSEYRVNVRTSPDYALRVRDDSWSCPSGVVCDGGSWDRALKLNSALSNNPLGKELWLSEGKYQNAFKTNNAVIYGGFDGTESNPDNRQGHPNNTILQGLAGQSVVVGRNLLKIDNVHITGGSSAVRMKDGRFSLEQSIIDGNSSNQNAVVYEGWNSSEAYMKRNYLTKNAVLAGVSLIAIGTGAYFYGENLAIAENQVDGAVIQNAGASKLVHTTVAYNAGVGPVYSGSGSNLAANSILYQPHSPLLGAGSNLTADHSLTSSGVAGVGNLMGDPKITPNAYGVDGIPFTTDDGLMPMAESPVVDKGLKLAELKEDLLTISRETSRDGSGNPDMGGREWFNEIANSITIGIIDPLTGKFKEDQIKMILEKEQINNSIYVGYELGKILKVSIPINKYTRKKDVIYASISLVNNENKELCPNEESGEIPFYKFYEGSDSFEFISQKIENGKAIGGKLFYLSDICQVRPNEENRVFLGVNNSYSFKFKYRVQTSQFR